MFRMVMILRKAGKLQHLPKGAHNRKSTVMVLFFSLGMAIIVVMVVVVMMVRILLRLSRNFLKE